MEHYRRTSHGEYDIKLHVVFVTKYRKLVLTGEYAKRTRELIRQTCISLDVEIKKGHVSKDHVPLLLSVPPMLSVSKVMQSVKGRTSRKLLEEYRKLKKEFWGRHLWARGYFVVRSGNVTDEVIAEYIANQDLEERVRDDGFRVDWE